MSRAPTCIWRHALRTAVLRLPVAPITTLVDRLQQRGPASRSSTQAQQPAAEAEQASAATAAVAAAALAAASVAQPPRAHCPFR